MTDEERREAEKLAELECMKHDPNLEAWDDRKAYVSGYAAGRESKTETVIKEVNVDYFSLFEAERARAAKLIEALKWYASPFSYITGNIGSIADLQARAIDALREMEASRD